ncbi:MAG: DnaA regulatory inactivator Hda [Gammaproteobacteria bacterium]
MAQALRRAVSEGEGELFLLWSSAPTGKSHLLQACCNEADKRGGRAAYLPLKTLSQNGPSVLEDVATCDVVTLDDIHCIAGIRVWEEAVFHCFNQIRQMGSTLIISSAQAPLAFTLGMPDLVSRIKSAEIYQIHDLRDDEKLVALIHRAAARGILITPEVGQYCLTRVGRDWLSLMTVLNAIDQHSIEQKRRVTVPFVKALLQDICAEFVGG